MHLIISPPVPLWLVFVLMAVACYLIGGFSSSFVIGKLIYHKDLRCEGSGNLGTTNALRCLGVPAGIVVLFLDGLKGAIAIEIARLLLPQHCTAARYATLSPLVRLAYSPVGYPAQIAYWALVVCALAAILGHAFSPYLKFRGGKAIATSAGIIIAMEPKAVLILLPIFIIVLLSTRYVSVASMAIAICYPFATVIFYPSLPFIILSVVAALFVIWLHRSNIVRLRAGTENRLTLGRSQPKA